jgi:hypothetical protein
MFVGQHAIAGAKNAVLAHSQSFSVKLIAINGREVGEVGQIAAIAGHFGIPVIMLAGDDAACAELTALQPKAVTVAVKRLAGKASSLSLSHAEAKRQIEEAARRAVTNVAEYPAWKIAGPVEMTIEHLRSPGQPAPRGPDVSGPKCAGESGRAWLRQTLRRRSGFRFFTSARRLNHGDVGKHGRVPRRRRAEQTTRPTRTGYER